MQHRPGQVKALTAADAIFTTYAYNVLAFYPELAAGPPKAIQWIPHASADFFFLPVKEQPERNKILLSG